MDQAEKKKPGRPRKHAEAGGRSSHSVWLTEETRGRIIAEAERKRISMSEEMAARIDQSFSSDLENMDDPSLAAFIRVVAMTLNNTKACAADGDLRKTYAAAVKTLADVWFRQEAPIPAPEVTFEDRAGALVAALTVQEFCETDAKPQLQEALVRFDRRRQQLADQKAKPDADYPDLAAMSAEDLEAKRVRDLEVLRSLVPRYRSMTDDEVEADMRAEAQA